MAGRLGANMSRISRTAPTEKFQCSEDILEDGTIIQSSMLYSQQDATMLPTPGSSSGREGSTRAVSVRHRDDAAYAATPTLRAV